MIFRIQIITWMIRIIRITTNQLLLECMIAQMKALDMLFSCLSTFLILINILNESLQRPDHGYVYGHCVLNVFFFKIEFFSRVAMIIFYTKCVYQIKALNALIKDTCTVIAYSNKLYIFFQK